MNGEILGNEMTSNYTCRRKFITGLGATPLLAACAEPLPSEERVLYLDRHPDEVVGFSADAGDTAPEELAVFHPREVAVDPDIPENTIIVFQDRLVLQHIEERGTAVEYPVGLGRAGLEFKGQATISRKAKWPSWTPTKSMIARQPEHYLKFAEGVPGGPGNPLGSRALYLFNNGVDTYYRIHGTDAPGTVRTYVSNGCIRLLNEHVEYLYERVQIGTAVHVVGI